MRLVGFDNESLEPSAFDDLHVGDPFHVLGKGGEALERHHVGSIDDWQQQTTGELEAALSVGDRKLTLHREHPWSPADLRDEKGEEYLPGQDIEVAHYRSGSGPRSAEAMQGVLDEVERRKKEVPLYDHDGKKICTVQYDPQTGGICAIQTEQCENTDAVAERNAERVCATDERGNLLDASLTRAEVRAQGKRYLLVTTLLMHDGDLLLQQRSKEKIVDPGALSSSAHGMAKQIFGADGQRVNDTRWVGFVNAALELNEELRNGAPPWNVKVWPGSFEELKAYFLAGRVDDPRTVYLVDPTLFNAQGYPLSDWRNARTRFVCWGFVMSTEHPAIQHDPAEVEGTQWTPIGDFVRQQNRTDDVDDCLFEMYENLLRQPRRGGWTPSERWVNWRMGHKFDPDSNPELPRTD